MRIAKRLWRFIERERVCRVATVSEDGTPHLVPVCHVVVDETICFGSAKDGRKVLNLRSHDQIAVTVDLYAEDWPQLKGVNTTTEFITKHVFDALAAAACAGSLGRDGRAIASIRVTVAESPVARAWYEAPVW